MNAQALISYYNSARDVAPSSEITVAELCRKIHDGETAAGVSAVRAAGNGDEKRIAKMKLPAVQISGHVTSGNRAKAFEEGRFVHSGFLQLDIDGPGLNGKTPDEAKAMLATDPHVLAAFISPSGKGAKGLLKIPVCENEGDHKRQFLAVQRYISEAYHLDIDPAPKNSGSLCYLPSDSAITWNGSVVEFVAPVEVIGNLSTMVDKPKNESQARPSASFPEPPEHGIHPWLATAAWHCRLKEKLSESETVARLESYDGTLRRRLTPNEARDAARTVFAAVLPTANDEIPADVLPVPAGAISYSTAATLIFESISEKRMMFSREGIVHEVISKGKGDILAPVTCDRFASAVEKLGKRICRREVKKTETESSVVWRKTTFPVSSAKVILATDEARALPAIRQLANCAIFTPDGEILTRGYHDFNGGTFISIGERPPDVELKAAVAAILGLLEDFEFVTPSDKSRAVASLISPAFKMGGHITDDFPLDVAEADQSQSGKTYRQKIVARLYNETPTAILQPKGGVGSLDEAISAALIAGRPFVSLDNFRGRVDSSILESAIRGHGIVKARALRESADVDTSPFLWQISTNGAELTRDLANRAIITRIRKRPGNYQFRSFLEGDLLAHIQARQSSFLGAVFAIVRAWIESGRPVTNDTRHDFRGWVRVMDWIVQNLFELPAMLDGHREEQARTANPRLQWLRDVCHAAAAGKMLNRELTTTELCAIAEDSGIEFPGNPNSREEPHQRAGKILGLLYRESEGHPVTVDGFGVARRVFTTWENGEKTHRNYTISNP